MKSIKLVTEENLPNIINRYYKFGRKEIKVGDSIGLIALENLEENESEVIEIRTFVLDENGVAYVLSDKKYMEGESNTTNK
jgi:hypothetical protein